MSTRIYLTEPIRAQFETHLAEHGRHATMVLSIACGEDAERWVTPSGDVTFALLDAATWSVRDALTDGYVDANLNHEWYFHGQLEFALVTDIYNHLNMAARPTFYLETEGTDVPPVALCFFVADGTAVIVDVTLAGGSPVVATSRFDAEGRLIQMDASFAESPTLD